VALPQTSRRHHTTIHFYTNSIGFDGGSKTLLKRANTKKPFELFICQNGETFLDILDQDFFYIYNAQIFVALVISV
jgi:hypothetical protein